MQKQTYEVEVKSLLGSKERADALKDHLSQLDPATKLVSSNKQLNHYFVGGDKKKLLEKIGPLLTNEKRARLATLLRETKDFSLRTRLKDTEVIIVLKISVNDETSANGVKRLEFEATIPGLTFEELDQCLLDASFTYQAKWSREREEYRCRNATVTIDKNAGYGYLAEFEKVVNDESFVSRARKELIEFMEKLDVLELPQDRLERMFAFYNKHWQEYYGTENIFVIE